MEKRNWLIFPLISAVVVAITVGAIATTSTLSDFFGAESKLKVSALASTILFYRLTEFGELIVNVPISKMPSMFHAAVPWIGLVLLILTLFGIATRRRRLGPTELFLICYMGVLFAWPFYDARFWLPVITLLIAYTVLAVKRLKLPSVVVIMYCALFATFGLAAIVYSTRITFAGSKFPDRYGDGSLRPTYCAALQSCSDSGGPKRVDAKVLRLLRAYN